MDLAQTSKVSLENPVKAHFVMTKFLSGENNRVCAQELILTTESSG